MIRSAMILAAGRGERMRPLSDTTPKPLIPVGGRAMLDRAMDRLSEHGVRNVVINVHHLGEQIAHHVGAGRAHIVHEDRLLDTGGSVKNALSLLGDGPFFVLNGDGLWSDGPTPMLKRLESAWDPNRMDALLLLHPRADAIGHEASDRGDYFLDDNSKARHRGAENAAPYMFASVSICDAPRPPAIFMAWSMMESGSMSARRRHWPRPNDGSHEGRLLHWHRPALRRRAGARIAR
jgi:MurNAc alpha-1-phosphate uridylyltransferase